MRRPTSLLAVRAPRAQADVSGFPKMIGLTVDNAPAIELCHRYEAMSAEAGHNVTAADIPFFRYCYLAETEEKARDEAYRPPTRLRWRNMSELSKTETYSGVVARMDCGNLTS